MCLKYIGSIWCLLIFNTWKIIDSITPRSLPVHVVQQNMTNRDSAKEMKKVIIIIIIITGITRDSCTGRYCWECVLAMAILSVHLSVRLSIHHDLVRIQDSGSSPYDSLESLVSYEVIWCWGNLVPLGEETPRTRASKRNRYFTTIGSSSLKTVADRHRLAAYHNKHCWRAFQWYQHRWPWMTLNPQNRSF